MGKLNVLAAVVGLAVFYMLLLAHYAYDTPYDFPIFALSVLLVAWALSDEHLERVIRLNSWIKRVSGK